MSVRFNRFLEENEEAYLSIARELGQHMKRALQRERTFRDEVLA